MKSRRHALPVWILLALGTMAPLLRADSNPAGSDDSSMWVDPDGVPKAFQPKPVITAGQRAAIKEQRQKALDKKEWMLRGYAAQLQELAKRKEGTAESTSDLEETAQLAKAAGLSVEDFPRTLGQEQLETSASEKRSSNPNLNSAASVSSPVTSNVLKPLLSTISTGSFLSLGQALPLLSATSHDESTETPDTDLMTKDVDNAGLPSKETSGDMDIPGLTAADSSSSTRQSMGLTDEDLLPGEPASAEKSHRALELELPPTTDTERLNKMQADATKVPGQVAKKAVPAPAPPQPQSDTEQMVHDPTPMRAHVEDPFSILH